MNELLRPPTINKSVRINWNNSGKEKQKKKTRKMTLNWEPSGDQAIKQLKYSNCWFNISNNDRIPTTLALNRPINPSVLVTQFIKFIIHWFNWLNRIHQLFFIIIQFSFFFLSLIVILLFFIQFLLIVMNNFTQWFNFFILILI